jgi:hypothetical protein
MVFLVLLLMESFVGKYADRAAADAGADMVLITLIMPIFDVTVLWMPRVFFWLYCDVKVLK